MPRHKNVATMLKEAEITGRIPKTLVQRINYLEAENRPLPEAARAPMIVWDDTETPLLMDQLVQMQINTYQQQNPGNPIN